MHVEVRLAVVYNSGNIIELNRAFVSWQREREVVAQLAGRGVVSFSATKNATGLVVVRGSQ